jgi:hypothetical protein
MCYDLFMANSAASPERATHRTVILLHKSDKAKLERLALKEKISSAEVVRRLIRHGGDLFKNKPEEEVIETALKMISTSVSDTNASLTRTMEKNIKRMDSRIDRIADDLSGIDRRVMRIEVLIDLTKQQSGRKGSTKELP